MNVRGNTWLDPVPVTRYQYPQGRWYTQTGWGRKYMREIYPENLDLMREYFKLVAQWTDAIQNDFAARADWCLKSYEEANHTPVLVSKNNLNLTAKPGSKILISAKGSYDTDGDQLHYKWWRYKDADTYSGTIEIRYAEKEKASFIVPDDAVPGETIHIICEVQDDGTPRLTRYLRFIVEVKL